MASEVKLKLNVFLALYFISFLIAEINSQRLEIFPIQSVQKKPIGKSMMLTCRPSVPDTTLITDLKWNDNLNNTVMPKSFEKYIPLYDSKGQRLPEMTGRGTPPMYTEYLPGDQSLALMITSLTESMAGIYNCTASYANTDLLQIGVQIETFVAITWKDAPENQFPILRDDYKIRCEVTANPSPTVDWMRNGDQIKTGGRYVVETHGLLIRNVQESDDGVYTCRAAVIQTGELVERNIRVEVQIKPQVQPLDSTIDAVEGQSFSIICNSTGKPVPEFVWVKDSTQENVANSDRFFVNPQTGLLTISRVEPDDYSKYTCIAKNSAGISESKMLLNVLVRPKIYELLNITIEIKHQASIICKASGRPAPEITFRRYGEQEEYLVGPQPSDDRIILEQSYDEDRGESNATFIITKTMRSDDGLYECIARNKGDTAYKVGHITIEYPPSFEHMKGLPPVFSWEERKANLSCLAQGIPNATIEWWWNTKRIEELYDRNLEIVGKGPRSDLLITPTDRRYYTAYKCIAKNRIGTVEHMMELREARVPEPIIQVTVNVVTATTISFNIVGPPSEFGMPILAYSAQYKQDLTPDWGSASNRTWSPDSPYIIEGLKPHTPYQFRFCARNLVGQGSWGAHKQQSTPRRSAPEEPKTLHTLIQEGSKEDDPIVISPYADHFELRWNIPSDNGEPIDYFEIRYCSGYKVNDVWNSIEDSCATKTVHVSETSYEMSNLQANSYYSIELLAHNAIGYSRSANLLLKTARGLDVIVHPENTVLSSSAIIAIAIGGILLLLLIVDLLCCIICNIGLSATICRRSKRSPSDFDDETKLGSLYGWRFPLPYCSTSVVKERPPSPLPLPPPVKFSGTPLTTPVEESQPLNSPNGSVMKNNSTVEFDGRVAHSRSGEIIGKNSAV